MDIHSRIDKMTQDLDNLITKAELWQLIFDESCVSIACFDDAMRFFLVNKAFCQLTGFSKEHIIGEKLKLVLPYDMRKTHSKYESDFKSNPQKKMNRHGLSPELIDINGKKIPINIDLSYIDYLENRYYISFIREKK